MNAPARPLRSLEVPTLEGFFGYHLRRASRIVLADLTKTLAPFDLRMITFSALAVVHDNPNLTQSALAGALDIEGPNLVQILDKLEKRNLVARRHATGDRRAKVLALTETGQQVFAQALAAVRHHDARMVQKLGSTTVEQMQVNLNKVGKGS